MHQIILYISPSHKDFKLLEVVVTFLVESVKTTSMKNESTRVIDKNMNTIWDMHFKYYCISGM